MIGFYSNLLSDIFDYLGMAQMNTIAHIQVLVAKNQEKYSDDENYKVFIIVSSVILTLFYMIKTFVNRIHLRREKTSLENTINDLKKSITGLKIEINSLKSQMQTKDQCHKTEINALKMSTDAKINALEQLVNLNTKKYDDVVEILSQNEQNQQKRHNETMDNNLALNSLAKFAIDKAENRKKPVVRKVKKSVKTWRLQ